MSSHDKWVQEVEKAVREKQEEDLQRDSAFLAKRELLKEQRPLLWEKVCKAFQSHCQAYNEFTKAQAAIFQTLNCAMFAIGRDGSDTKLIVSNMPPDSEISLVGEGWEFHKAYKFAVITNGIGKVILQSDNGMPESPEGIAAAALREFLVQTG